MKANPKKILILISQVGGGHLSISQAVQQIITAHAPCHQIKIFNNTPVIGSLIQRIIGNYFAKFYTKNYQALDNESSAKLVHQLITPLIFPKLSQVIVNFKPDLIIATNSFSTEEVNITLKILNKRIPHVIILADPFSIHHGWTSYKQADLYLVHDSNARSVFINRRINPKKIKVTGLPLRQEIYQSPLSLPKVRRQLHLDRNKLTIFIGGSGEGLGNIYSLVAKLLKTNLVIQSCQLIVACGKNKLLLDRFKRLQKKYPQAVFPFGYTNQIPQLISASNFVIGKPGPNILLETFTLGRSFIATGQPLGQEENNYQYIVKHHLGQVAFTIPDTFNLILKIIKSPQLLNQYSPYLKRWQKSHQSSPQKIWQALKPFL